MKRIINIFIATGVMAALAVTSFAQGAGPKGGAQGGAQGKAGQGQKGPGGRRGGFGNMDAEILAKLNLTEAQKKDIKTLKEATQKKMMEMIKAGGGPGGDRSAMREKLKPVMDGYQTGLKKIMTPAQFSEYEKAMKEMRKKFQNRGPGGPGAGGPGAGKGAGKGKGGGN
jgi:Spy/CpxP family protein refolding chaperone